MTDVIVRGAAGRMGIHLVSLLLRNEKLRLFGAIERKGHPASGRDAGEFAGLGKSGIIISETIPSNLPKETVCIDFSSPESTLGGFRWAEENRIPLVIGTTGFNEEQSGRISALAKKIPVVFSPNMSIGVNLMFKLLKEAASKLSRDYDMEIVELHHHLKKDAPSGTALKMARILADSLGEKLENVAVYHREGMIGERKKKEIGIQTVRAGDIVGEHTVYFVGPGERLEITHKASSRENFAQGALVAAGWLSGKSPGLYDMQAVLGL